MAEASGKPDPEPQEPPAAPPRPNVIKFSIGGAVDDHSICLRMVERAKKDKRVQEMVNFIQELGCPLDLNKVVECRPCGIAATGGFIQNTKNLPEGEYTPKVLICEDNLLGNKYVKQTLLHELVHAYDQCRAKVNWKSCYHIACTELRASTLSGECDFIEEFDRSIFAWQGQHKVCVRRRAQMSLEMVPQCRKKAQEVIDKVFDECYHDTAPYEFIP